MPTLLTTNIPPQYIGEATVHLPVGKVAVTIHLRFTVFGELLEYQCPVWELPEAALLLTFDRKELRSIDAEIRFLPYRLTFMAYMPLLCASSPKHWQSVVQQLQKLRGFKMPKQLPYPKCQAFTQLFARWFKPSKAQYEEELAGIIEKNIDMGVLANRYYDEWMKIPVLLYFLRAPFWSELRSSAAYNLRMIKDKSVLPCLVDALQDEDRGVRKEAVETLNMIGDQSIVEPLIEVLKDPFHWIRSAAAEALANIPDVRSFEPLILLLNDNHSQVRISAVKSLGKLADVRAVEPLIYILLNDENLNVQAAAAYVLGYLGDTQSVEPLIEFLATKRYFNESGLYNAVEALGLFNDLRCIPALIDTLNSTHKHIRQCAAEILLKMGDATVEPLIAVLNHEAILTRHHAILLLTKLNDKRALLPLLQRQQIEIHSLCKEALQEAIHKLHAL
jgi:HEAT repeat protein